jgi:hypothetical protein
LPQRLSAPVKPSLRSPNVLANGQTYTPRSEEEVEVLFLVVASEIKANNWAKSEWICFSVNSLDPTAALVKSLRKRNFNVRSPAEWAKKFNCGFELQLEYTQFDLSQSVKVRSKVVDLREINKGEGDLAILQKDGEYSLRRGQREVVRRRVRNETPGIAAFFMKVGRTTTHFTVYQDLASPLP